MLMLRWYRAKCVVFAPFVTHCCFLQARVGKDQGDNGLLLERQQAHHNGTRVFSPCALRCCIRSNNPAHCCRPPTRPSFPSMLCDIMTATSIGVQPAFCAPALTRADLAS